MLSKNKTKRQTGRPTTAIKSLWESGVSGFEPLYQWPGQVNLPLWDPGQPVQRVLSAWGCRAEWPRWEAGTEERLRKSQLVPLLIVVNKGCKALSLRVTQNPPSDTILWRQLSPFAPKFPPVLGEEASHTLTCAQKLDAFFVRCGTKRSRYIIYNEFGNLQIFVLKESCILITIIPNYMHNEATYSNV